MLISPSITRAGFVVGGSGGDALLLARDDGGRWAGPAFYNMGTASVGFQAGVDQSEVVILVMNEKALDALLSRSVKLGGDASVAAGPVGVGASGTVNADMITFSRSKGLFAGVSLEGAVISPIPTQTARSIQVRRPRAIFLFDTLSAPDRDAAPAGVVKINNGRRTIPVSRTHIAARSGAKHVSFTLSLSGFAMGSPTRGARRRSFRY